MCSAFISPAPQLSEVEVGEPDYCSYIRPRLRANEPWEKSKTYSQCNALNMSMERVVSQCLCYDINAFEAEDIPGLTQKLGHPQPQV